ncbi:MAG: hypothetical protein AAF298_17525 [Cyanobacteria bacterium P01_A01_bin.40]
MEYRIGWYRRGNRSSSCQVSLEHPRGHGEITPRRSFGERLADHFRS